ncbi:MAG: pentapeptide repeat-containing protein [Deltaproteobacteria bacterium]|nr:pentapeptide repeat-containing protein [Deltaproteobacteria bacterium]
MSAKRHFLSIQIRKTKYFGTLKCQNMFLAIFRLGKTKDLRQAILHSVDLSRSNLNRINLSETNLSNADLSWTDLSFANLHGADLSDANLNGANLTSANFSETKMPDTIRWIIDNDQSNPKND